jgi:hypothetical protein
MPHTGAHPHLTDQDRRTSYYLVIASFFKEPLKAW